MMKFLGALILFMTLSAAYGLRCHICNGKTCTNPQSCPVGMDRCALIETTNAVSKNCMNNSGCGDTIKCCETDLCNSAISTGSSVLLLLVSSGIITLFL
ncbi:lymphocyte antigen 6D-like [Plectropomus leopardus]|uniref:lymphocyte antigen 6D-like n=1 Tax=Plectropomus leopardus TaxID=160734 RepID=UPI001C4AD542|nr:lymphocyte antigen 6D-like [Plectropomus leopardus]